jgi:glycosyltransferase involved in cell wall biosynthesis
MRVLMTTDTVGGVWTFTQELAQGLLEQGCAVALFSLGRHPSREQRAWTFKMRGRWNDMFRFEYADIPLEWMEENSRSYVEAEPLLVRLAEEFGAEVLHSNQFCFGALPVSIPKVVTAHSDVLSWAAACLNMPLQDSAWLQQYRLLVSSGLKAVDALIAPTQWMMEALYSNFRLPEGRQVIANGRDVPHVFAMQRKLQGVTAGRLWDRAKGTSLLHDVRSPMPLLIAGESSSEQTRNVKPSGAAQWVGALTEMELLALFCESAIYICTSLYEPFGLAPLEAALCGCAVVARNVGSLREVWGDGAVYFGDADELSQTLQALSADPRRLERAQAASSARARNYTRHAMASAYRSKFEALRMRDQELCCVA